MLNTESEFEIIQRYFTKNKSSSSCVIKGIGDDAAVIDVSNQSNLVVSMDTLIQGVHFPINTNPYDIAVKSLAVNLSDLAAMGATPSWFTLALTLPNIDSKWLSEFSRGLFDMAKHYDVELIGGDTTSGPNDSLSITIQIAGYVDNNIMYRSGAQVNDDIYVSGYLGDAGAALQLLVKENDSEFVNDYLITRLNKPTPRILLGKTIREISNSCIDISDGLAADLDHIIESSKCGALINVDKLPISNELHDILDNESCFDLALSSGDDYELCFTVAEKFCDDIQSISRELEIPITKIGKVVEGTEVRFIFDSKPYTINSKGYEHFK